MARPRQAFVVSHTHWDREWYLTFDRFRVRLVEVVRRVLDALEGDDTFRHFVLDGQSVILEDYLEVRPDDAERIRALVSQGALSVGPWYILPDEFLVSGESTVRNLLLGHKTANRFGPVQKVGYMPDSFGHIAQMPQILRRAGIESFVYTRGNGDEIDELGHEYRWCAPDGSEVLAINQCGGYCNAGGLGHQEIWHAHTRREIDLERAAGQVRELFEKMGALSRGDIYLLNNGCDHFPPQRDLGPILEHLRGAFPGTEFRQTSLAEYIEAVKSAGFATRSYTGELLGGRLHPILSGVWSARIYLKQLNDTCQNLLASYVEPLCCYSHFCLGQGYPAGEIEHGWKSLLRNHPHDSICGCSTDEVHEQMVPRFAGVIDSGDQLLRDRLEQIAPTFGRREADDRQNVISVFNPLAEIRSEVVERIVVLQPLGYEIDNLQLVDEAGRPVPFRIVERRYLERFWGVDYRTEPFYEDQKRKLQTYLDRFGDRIVKGAAQRDSADCFLTLQFLAMDLPAMGHANYFLRETSAPQPLFGVPRAVTVTGDALENEHYRVQLHPDGTFDVLDKSSDTAYVGLNALEDTEDVGDEYDYAPCSRTRTVSSDGVGGKIRIMQDSGWIGQLEAAFDLSLPRSVTGDRKGRTRATVRCPVRVRLGLKESSRIIEVELLFDNHAEDHRLRACFPTGIETDTLVSDGHFLVNRRPIRQPDGKSWVQPPPGTYPQQDFSLVQNSRHGLAVLNRGLPEIEATHDRAGRVRLHLTLLRAVGWLSRDDFATRRFMNAGPTLHTPGAQCRGPQCFRYAVVPFDGDGVAAGIKALAQRYRAPVAAIQGVEDQLVPGGSGLLRRATKLTAISGVKKHESRDSLVIRLYNLTPSAVDERLTLGRPIRSAWRISLLEERSTELPPATPHELAVSLGPHEILTLEIELESPEGNAS